MRGSVFGISAFKGRKGHQSPHHGFVTGKTGSGKSVFGNDFLTQLDLYSDKTVVVDFGDSYGLTMAVLSGNNCRPFAPDPNGQDTLNYFDTGGSPMSTHFRQSIVSVLHLMTGKKPAEDEDFLRRAVLSRSLGLFLEHWSQTWIDREPERRGKLLTLQSTLRRFKKQARITGDLTDVYSAWRNAAEDEAGPIETELHARRHRSEPDEEELMNLSFALMSAEEVPTHSSFCDWLDEHKCEAQYCREELEKLALLLEVWRADRGIMGRLFDGINTIDLGARHVHIELAGLADADETIRSLVSYVLSNKILGAMARMPRAKRKHVVLEELGAFLNIKGASQIVRDFYERARKYNCFVLSVIQQISNLPDAIARSVVGNCKQGFFFSQKDVRDVELLQELFELPDNVADMLRGFKEPSKEHGASFICWEDLGDRTRITPAANIAGREMLFVTNSSGSVYEERARALAQYDDLLEGVKIEAAQES